MPVACTGGYQFGNRYLHCWEPKGHGNLTLAEAIEKSCDVYFYQLGLKVGLSQLVAGGIKLGCARQDGDRSPDEARPIFPYDDVTNYFNSKYGTNGWSQAVVLNLVDRPGRERADGRQHGALLHGARDRRQCGEARRSCADKPERTQILSSRRISSRGCARRSRA